MDSEFFSGMRRILGDSVDADGNAITPESLIEDGERAIRKQADEIARSRGFDSADDVLATFKGVGTDETRERINEKLDRDFSLEFFADLCDRAKGAVDLDAQEAAEERGGCTQHDEFVAMSERASAARAAGSPDIEAELKIASTTDAVIEGRDAGEGL